MLNPINVHNNQMPVNDKIAVKEIKGSKQINALMKEAQKWIKAAQGKMNAFPADSDEAAVAQDCSDVAKTILSRLKFIKKNKYSVFAAYDSDKKVQGIALAKMPRSKHASELKYMVVNPESIKSIGKKPIRGTGTALVTKIASKILNNKKAKKELRTQALWGAVPFYEKLGFKNDLDHPPLYFNANAMKLTEKDMKKLIAQK